jgi:hypothetical protein
MSHATCQFDYRPGWGRIILGIIFCSACASIFGSMAGSNVFYWGLAALSVGMVLAAALMAVVRLVIHQHIGLGPASITLPRSRWSSEHVEVPYADIISASPSQVCGEQFLAIEYDGGKFTIGAAMLPSKDAFHSVLAAVLLAVEQAHRPGEAGP